MIEEQIIEGNKLIAEFIGLEWDAQCKAWYKNNRNAEWGISTQDLKYNSSWDWIMPVVEKICKTDSKYSFILDVCTNLTEVRFYEETTQKYETGRDFEIVTNTSNASNTILAIWQAVVEFIKWYNKKTNK